MNTHIGINIFSPNWLHNIISVNNIISTHFTEIIQEVIFFQRRKNNAAAKRSREARRSRENQIAMRASYLEKDNQILKEELLSVK